MTKTQTPPASTTDNEPERKGTGLMNMIKSTLAAAIGVQTNNNRERDFKEGKASSFIFAGVAFMLIFILVIYAIVQWVLSMAAA